MVILMVQNLAGRPENHSPHLGHSVSCDIEDYMRHKTAFAATVLIFCKKSSP
jgi:hypothetical protein